MPSPTSPEGALEASYLGTLCYDEAMEVLSAGRADAIADMANGLPARQRVYLLEHYSTVTVGRRGSLSDVLVSAEDLVRRGVEVRRCDRGGEVTWHGPGQLVAYPVLSLVPLGLRVPALVAALGGAVLDVLADFDIVGRYDPDRPGVWVGALKVASLGLRIAHSVTTHGLALNVCNSLEPFSWIVACRSQGATMTSMAELLGPEVASTLSVQGVGRRLATHLAERLGLSLVGPLASESERCIEARGRVGNRLA